MYKNQNQAEIEKILKERETYLQTQRNEIEENQCELSFLKNEINVYSNMLEEAKKLYEEEERKLDEMCSEVWDNRMKFSEDVKAHLMKYDCLFFKSHIIKENVMKKHDEQNLRAEIEKLEREIELLENDYQEFKSNLNIIQQLKNSIKILEDEPMVGLEFKKLRSKIESCSEELKQLNWLKEASDEPSSKYLQLQLNSSIDSALDDHEGVKKKTVYVTPYTTQLTESPNIRKGFVAKVPSCLISKKY